MTAILAIETSTMFCSAALYVEGVVFSTEIVAGQRHSQLILPMVRQLLAETGLSLQQLDGVSFGAGPGSFTGLRIACGVAQGLAYVSDLPVVAISTLEAVAETLDCDKVIVAFDARMGEIYHAAYQRSVAHGWEIVCAPSLCLPHQAPSVSGTDWHGCGSGFDLYGALLSAHYRDNLRQIHPDRHPHAMQIVQLALPELRDRAGVNAAAAAPVYVRNKVALKESER
ncbi:MAG: tRNA (adenosine(37)-N6)-threonylcarbamoyltransferase complex dimerization subunit type 1 TsaB [Nitrosomonas sp.]|nr:MAG: tRNA (adenosine(37)-N6)-threonylcarbamoyltransferase complex dimerization subunit type 1 TsaB [Nitrosomonas sp.]